MAKQEKFVTFSPAEVDGLLKCVDEKIMLNIDLYHGKKIGSGLTKEKIESRLDFWKALREKVDSL